MADNLPNRRIDREALERIIQRATELQAGEVDTGDSLTEQELIKLGSDVGIDGRFLRQALYEESAGPHAAESGLLAKWFGPGTVGAGRVVPGDRAQVEAALEQWMTDGEALTVKRRMGDRTVWEQQRGFLANMKRGLGAGGRNYMLAKAHDVTVVVTSLEAGYCHVELSADVSHQRSAAIGGSVAGTGSLVLVSGAAFAFLSTAVVFPFAAIAVIPLAAAAAVPLLTGRSQRAKSAHMQLALEQILDRLEHGEIKPRHKNLEASPIVRFADDIRRAITEGIEQGRRPQRRLP